MDPQPYNNFKVSFQLPHQFLLPNIQKQYIIITYAVEMYNLTSKYI